MLTPANADLIARAAAVQGPVGSARISARSAARCLWGVMSLVARQTSTKAMQHACASLVRADVAWTSALAVLPVGLDERVSPELEQIAVVARGILPLCDAETMRAALSFWAVESDPAEWQRVAGIAA